MNPEVKKLWVEALRSGKYKQGKSRLRRGGEYCCLGVLCDISGLGEWEGDDYVTTEAYGYRSADLPPAVEKWAGLKDSFGGQVSFNGIDRDLAYHNDVGRTFAEIADTIEAQL